MKPKRLIFALISGVGSFAAAVTKALAVTTLFVTLTTTSFALSSFPDGHWIGGGRWATSDGKAGVYTDELTIKANTVSRSVTVEGKTWTTTSKFVFEKNNFIRAEAVTASPEGKTRRFSLRGYCGDVVTACTIYSFDTHTHFGATIHFDKDTVSEIGAASKPGGVIARWDGTVKTIANE